jgi:hypothetical protein
MVNKLLTSRKAVYVSSGFTELSRIFSMVLWQLELRPDRRQAYYARRLKIQRLAPNRHSVASDRTQEKAGAFQRGRLLVLLICHWSLNNFVALLLCELMVCWGMRMLLAAENCIADSLLALATAVLRLPALGAEIQIDSPSGFGVPSETATHPLSLERAPSRIPRRSPRTPYEASLCLRLQCGSWY